MFMAYPKARPFMNLLQKVSSHPAQEEATIQLFLVSEGWKQMIHFCKIPTSF